VKRQSLLGVVGLLLVVAVLFAVAPGGGPDTTVTVSNDDGDFYAIEIYQVPAGATVEIERDDGTTETLPPGEVDLLSTVSMIHVPANESRDAVVVWPNATASANATATGSRFVYVVHDGDPDGRTYAGVGFVDCGDRTPEANLTITDGSTRLHPNPCT
jgi:hypothetical protein